MKPKIYRLFDAGFGKVTCYTNYYGQFSKTIYHVAANSVRQAYLLAGRLDWLDPDASDVGVLEVQMYKDGYHRWVRFDQVIKDYPSFEKGKGFIFTCENEAPQ
jgi:hypothetical protein